MQNAAASLAVPLAASLLGCLAVLALIAVVLLLVARHRRRSIRDMPAQKKADALPITVDARAPQQVSKSPFGIQYNCEAAMFISIMAKPQEYAFDMKDMQILVALLSTKILVTRVPKATDGALLASFRSSAPSDHQHCLSHRPQRIDVSFGLQ